MHLEAITKLKRLQEIVPAWRALILKCQGCDLFSTPPWLLAWYESIALPRNASPLFLAMWEQDKMIALFPLQTYTKAGCGVLAFAGFPRHADRMDILIENGREDEVLMAFLDWLAQNPEWGVMTLRHFGAFSHHPERLDAVIERAGWRHLLIPDAKTFHIDLSYYKNVEDYLENTRSARTRKAIRRRERRIAERLGGQWSVLHEIDDTLLAEMAELDCKRSVRGERGEAFFTDPLNEAFIRALRNRFAGSDVWRLTNYRAAGKLMAYDLSFDLNDRRMSYQTAYDKFLAPESMGHLTLIKALDVAFEEGAREFDFLAGEEAYKEQWCRLGRASRRLVVYRPGARGALLYTYHRWIKPLRRILGHTGLASLIPTRLRQRFDV